MIFARITALIAALNAFDKSSDVSLALFDPPHAGEHTRVTLMSRVRAAVDHVRALMGDPAAYNAAIPALVRVETTGKHPPALQIAWELEVPLWNLKGKLWMKPLPDGVEMDLTEGDFSPGHIVLHARPDGGIGGSSVLVVEATTNARDVNWLTRRLVKEDPRMESAMTATAGWVLLRALVLAAENRPRPATAITAPLLDTLDGRTLARAAALDAHCALAAVHMRPDGRLARIEVALATDGSVANFANRIADPQTWRALPGWHRIDASRKNDHLYWNIDSRLALVDFDAIWDVRPGPVFRAIAVAGDWQTVIMGWDVTPDAAVFSIHPRLDKAGYVPRKFIEAEPLLEHGLALGLAYVDAMSMAVAQMQYPMSP